MARNVCANHNQQTKPEAFAAANLIGLNLNTAAILTL